MPEVETKNSNGKPEAANSFYRFRGEILGGFALLLFVTPGTGTPVFRPSLVVAILGFIAGAMLRIESRRSIGEHTRGKRHEASELVTTGAYARLRHPLYVSNFVIALSIIIFHLGFNLWAIPFACTVAGFEVYLSHAEDAFLRKRFGSVWDAWAKETPAFFPTFTRHAAHSAPKRPILQAFCADGSTWAWLMFVNLIVLLEKFL